MNALTENLQAAGLNPIVLDEHTDFDALPVLVDPAPEAAATPTPAEYLMNTAKLVIKTLGKIEALDTQLATQRELVREAKAGITAALDNGGTGFDEASRAFKAANNKLDRLLDTRSALLKNATADWRLLDDAAGRVANLIDDLEQDV